MLKTILNALRNEPIRVRIYGLTVLVAGYLHERGLIDLVDVRFAGAAALIIFGAETARRKVIPTRKLDSDLLAARNRPEPVDPALLQD
ncbi:hypothetical protein EFK50_00965 [Nocardioides marmoriginsengisoli]|uniref:Uncharacterized protein n=1 Tax=Nocardioides marmoriginsengisoli TaxID=661483 RepID=A0A3N0CRZ3_9ACTN|nr:hypothetical protein [Nocardioides marmoriginsengisoli]RNL66227.1 hypothetical protein EFK50_00965 [Nocardioides marmoriginsengisoli]